MDDLATILASHRFKGQRKIKHDDNVADIQERREKKALFSEIPDVFFDDILLEFKLGRADVLVLMYFYRRTWCRPNLYKDYGIGPLLSLQEVALELKLDLQDVQHSLQKLESLSLIETIRLGQYFIRRYFTEKNDQLFAQNYDDF